MKRGEVWWVDVTPSVGDEIRKTRPAGIVSNNAANAALNRVTVVPLTSNTERMYPGEAFVRVARKRSKALGSQIMTVSKLRLKGRLVALSADDMDAVEEALMLQLGLRK